MSKLPKIVIGIGFSFLIILIAVGFFLRHLVIKSFPLNDGSLTIDALHQSVEIFRQPNFQIAEVSIPGQAFYD